MTLRFYPVAASALTLALALSACGGSDSWLGEQPTLAGQIDAWSRGSAFTLQASILQLPPATSPVVATAPIDDTGHFSIVLPRGDTITPFLTAQHVDSSKIPAGCTGSIDANPADFGQAVMTFEAVQGTTSLSVSLGNQHGGANGSEQVIVGFIYSDRDVTQTGDLTCSAGPAGGSSARGKTDLHWKTGWNQEVFTLSNDLAGGLVSTNLTTGPLPDEVKWTAK